MRITIRQPLTFSEIGRKNNQEDRVYPLENEATTQNRVFVLCDGMGGVFGQFAKGLFLCNC